MKYLSKIFRSLVIVSMMLTVMGCVSGCKGPTQNTSLTFKATNNSSKGEKTLSANSRDSLTIITETSITLDLPNGTSTFYSITRNGNVLPVIAGNEVEIEFTPSCIEETEAFLTLPDGKTQKVTASSPSFKWTVPDNFKSGMEIIGESSYETDDAKYKASGKIILISIES